MSGVVFENTTVPYDGQEHSITATNLLAGVTVTYEGNGKVNAGTYTVTAHFTGDIVNYEAIPDKTATLTISKATYDMSGVVFANDTVTYNGQPHSITATNLPAGVTVTYEGNGKVNAGTYTVTAHFTGDTVNYEAIPEKTVTLTISKATYDMSGVVFADETVPYDGQTHSIFATNLPDGVTVTYEGNGQTTVGEHKIIAKFTGDATNYEPIPDKKAKLTIVPLTLSGISFESKSVVYDGTPKSLYISGELPDDITVTYEGNGQISAGEYTITAKFTAPEQYGTLPNLTATLTITKATYDMSGVVFANTTVTYNGQEHSIYATNLPNGVSVTYENNGQIHVGEYEITAKFTGDSTNYELIPNKTAKLNITPAELSGISFDNKSFVYDGQPKSLFINIELPDGVSVTYEGNGMTTVGKYTVKAIFTTTSDYKPLPELTATLTIMKATYDMSGVVFENTTVTYNGEEHSIFATNLPAGVSVAYEGNGKVNAGTYTVTAKFSGDATNYYLIENKTATLTIDKATYDMSGVVFDDLTVKYDGGQHSITATNLPEGVSVTYENNNQIEKGEYTIIAKFTGDSVNYELIANKTATLTITRETHTVTFKQEGQADIVREVLDLAGLAEDEIPTPVQGGGQGIGYTIVWDEDDFSCITEDITVNAIKKPIVYTITYYLNGGENASENPATYTIETGLITLFAPTKAYYQFDGWYRKSDFSGAAVTTIADGEIGHIELYAKWSEVIETAGLQYDFDSENGVYTVVGYNGTDNSVFIPSEKDGYPVTSIGEYAFYGCTGLATVYWNAVNCTSAGRAGYPIFSGCTALTTVVFGDNVQTIPLMRFMVARDLER